MGSRSPSRSRITLGYSPEYIGSKYLLLEIVEVDSKQYNGREKHLNSSKKLPGLAPGAKLKESCQEKPSAI